MKLRSKRKKRLTKMKTSCFNMIFEKIYDQHWENLTKASMVATLHYRFPRSGGLRIIGERLRKYEEA